MGWPERELGIERGVGGSGLELVTSVLTFCHFQFHLSPTIADCRFVHSCAALHGNKFKS